MSTIHENEVQWLELSGRRCRVIVGGPQIKADHITFGVTEVPPRTRMLPHTHHREEEVIYILKGWGEVVVNGTVEPIREGTAIYLPVGSEHCVENKSEEVMRFTFAFSPPARIGSYDS